MYRDNGTPSDATVRIDSARFFDDNSPQPGSSAILSSTINQNTILRAMEVTTEYRLSELHRRRSRSDEPTFFTIVLSTNESKQV